MNSNNKFRKYWDSLVSFIINHMVWAIIVWGFGVITLNLPSILGAINLANNFFIPYSGFLSILSAILSVILIIVFINAYILKPNKNGNENTEEVIPTNPTIESSNKVAQITRDKNVIADDGLINDINIEEFKVELYLKSRTEIIYKLWISGAVNKESVDHFSKELTWSGSKYLRTEVYGSNVGNNIDDNVGNRTKSPYKYTLYFDNAKYSGEPVQFGFKTFVLDEENNMLPMSLFHIKYPIEKLTMVLSVDNSVKIRNIRKIGYNDVSRESRFFAPKRIVGEDYGDLTKYSYSVNQPTAWKHYAIEWDFE